MGIAWSGFAATTGGPLFAMFGVVFCCVAIGGIVVSFYNAAARPEDRIGGKEIVDIDDFVHCKECGKPIDEDSVYCRFCGRKQ
ncbi:MAG: hypothetical protein K1X74_23115 [Pirellulales bacterium]|nr:hypothetical protein [Pirellulales bacterium]